MKVKAREDLRKKLDAFCSKYGSIALWLGVGILLVCFFRPGSIERMRLEFSARQKLEAIYGSASSSFRHFIVLDPIENVKVDDRLLPWEVYVYFESEAKQSTLDGKAWQVLLPPDHLAPEYLTFITSHWPGISGEILKQSPKPGNDRNRMYLINDRTGTRHVLIFHRVDPLAEIVEQLNKLNGVTPKK